MRLPSHGSVSRFLRWTFSLGLRWITLWIMNHTLVLVLPFWSVGAELWSGLQLFPTPTLCTRGGVKRSDSAQILKTRGGALFCLFTLARRLGMISWLTVDFFNPIKAWNDRLGHRHAASHGLFVLFRNQWWCRVREEEAEHPVTDSSQSTRMGAV